MTTPFGLPLAGLLMLLAAPSFAQTHPGRRHADSDQRASPYAGMEQRAVKALSDDQIADLRAGRGMGLALAAELNGYPGPMHVLEHADALGLAPEFKDRVHRLIAAMRLETATIGERIIVQEAALDRQFAERRITPADVSAALERIGAAQGELRAAHLRYHLTMRDLLTPEQVERYEALRGYRPR